jgi:beta-phosphoglucomutase-like phosphatase (HAD superfamily)
MIDKPVEAVIFDMDGLLIDTEAVYVEAYRAGAALMGVEMPLAFCHSMIGTPSPECDRMIQDFFGPAFRLDDFNGHVDGHAHRLLEAGVPVKPGAVELLAFLGERGLPLAIATLPDIVPPTDAVRAKCLAVLPDLHAALGLLRRSMAHGQV